MKKSLPPFKTSDQYTNGLLEKAVLDNSGANYAGLDAINILQLLAGWISFNLIIQVKYLNNIIEQDHRFN